MWHDNEIDMEELEARLYSQVYHSNEGELPTSKPNIIPDNLTAKPPNRYFDGNETQQPPYGAPSIHRVYQRHPNDKQTYFQASQNVPTRQPTLLYPDSANFCDQMGLFRYPAVNNIVVLPQPPTQIFSQPQHVECGMFGAKKSTLKRRERRKKRQKEKWQEKRRDKAFRKHKMKMNLEQKNESEDAKDEVICLSESDDSDCEIKELPIPSIVLSSDDEIHNKELHHPEVVEIKNESNTNSSSNNNKDIEQFKSKEIEAVSSNTNKIENSDIQQGADDDDDVVFIEPCQTEIVTISDEPQSVTDANTSINLNLNITENFTTTTTHEKVSNKTRSEIIDTPESTNDFLDNSFNSTQNSVDAFNQKLSVNDFESDSNFSDFDAPSRNGIFDVQEFDVPPQDSFSELNLDTFTDYIASKASTSIPSILTHTKGSSSRAVHNNKSKNASSKNSSDSSSESDYEDKVGLIETDSKTKQVVIVENETSSSESEDCVINDDRNNLLPNLSPITSDDEMDPKIKSKQKKKLKEPRTSGEKRKAVLNVEVLEEIKKIKQSKEKVNKIKTTHESDPFFSSDDDSEVEIIQNENKSPTNFDVELLNVDNSSSTPIKQSVDSSTVKRKRFSDYWTEDMKKFYCESWGHENFNTEDELQTMSDDPKMWKIIYNDQSEFRLLPRGPRCYRCKEFGHRSNMCRKKFSPPKCILCGDSGHLDARCPNKLCTSCGRRSYYSTTYCSRCAHTKHVNCKICLMRGHSASNCTDLWRRYHLTLTNGPLKRPSDSNLKQSKDRWCSGCASRGHFEFNCNYYNRTHAPANPVICSYDDVYEKHGHRKQTNVSSSQSQGQTEYLPLPNQVSPWLPIGCQVYDQRLGPNFMPNHGANPNFYQQFPVFQSMPSIFSLQENLNHVFYQNSDLMAGNRSNPPDNYVPNISQSNTEKNCVAEIPPQPTTSRAEPQGEGIKKRDFLKLKDISMGVFLNKEGMHFLKKLSRDMNVKIKIIKRKKKKKFSYWCMVEGAPEILPKVKELIKNHYKIEIERKSGNITEIFPGKNFIEVVKERITKLDSDRDWPKVANRLYGNIKENKKKLSILKIEDGFSENIKVIENALVNQYIDLNSIVIGKAGVGDGDKHMIILRDALKGSSNKPNEENLIESYKYVFKNRNSFEESYDSAISNLSLYSSKDMKTNISNLFQLGMAICKDINKPSNAHKFRNFYNNVISNQYTQKHVNKFQSYFHRIKEKSKNY